MRHGTVRTSYCQNNMYNKIHAHSRTEQNPHPLLNGPVR